MSGEKKSVVAKRVVEPNVYNVVYQLEDAQIYDEKPVISSGSATNDSDVESTLTIHISYEFTDTYTFSNSSSITTGVPLTIQAGIPRVEQGKIVISPEITFEFEWGEPIEKTQNVEISYAVVVPPKSQATVNFSATHAKCKVPFSYTQQDKKNTDGIFTGANYGDFRFEQVQFECL